MMQSLELDYARTVTLTEAGRILDIPLQPLCLGHELLLQGRGSPFALHAKRDADFGDLLLGLGICSRTYEDAKRWLRSWRSRLWLKRMNKTAPLNVDPQIGRFYEYVAYAWQRPNVTMRSSGGLPMGTPMVVLLYLARRALGDTESQAWNTPVRRAQWEYLALRESLGDLTIPPVMDKEALEAARHKAVALQDKLLGR